MLRTSVRDDQSPWHRASTVHTCALVSKLLNWTPAKAPRPEEVGEEVDGPFADRAMRIMNRDLSETGYVPRTVGSYNRTGDLCIFRCEIVDSEQSVEAMWIYAECQRSGNFSTYFLF